MQALRNPISVPTAGRRRRIRRLRTVRPAPVPVDMAKLTHGNADALLKLKVGARQEAPQRVMPGVRQTRRGGLGAGRNRGFSPKRTMP